MAWPPPDTRENVMSSIEQAIDRAAWLDPWMRENPPTIEWFGWDARVSQQEVDHPLPQTVKRYAEELGYGPIKFVGFPGGDDNRWFRLQGRIPAITYGANGGHFHGIDEYVNINSLPRAMKVLTLSILDWCGFD